MSATSIHNNYFESLFLEFFHTLLCYNRRVSLRQGAVVGNFRFGGILFKLVECTSAECVSTYKAGFKATGLIMSGKLRTGCCFAGTLKTDKHYHIWPAFFWLEWFRVRVNQFNELIKDSLISSVQL